MNLYRKYGHLINWFANTDFGKDYLSGRGITIPKQDTVLTLTHNSILLQKGKGEFRLLASVDGNFYDRKLFKALKTIDVVSLYLNDFSEAKETFLWGLGVRSNSFLPRVIKQYHFATSTFTPDASHVDGRVGRNASNESWATKQGSAGDASQTGNGSGPQINASTSAGSPWAELFRRPEPADTSSLPDSATLQNTSKFRIFVNTVTQTLAGQSLALIPTTAPSSLSGLVNSDYNLASWSDATRQATDKTLASLSTGAFNDFVLNATGLSAINKTGVTMFGLRLAADADNAEPSWSSGAIAALTVDAYSGTNPAQYVIDYIQNSPSVSPSLSPSASKSPSSSVSPSLSPSSSASPSSSMSASVSSSPSRSASASPSEGFADFTRHDLVNLPADDTDLATIYTAQEVIDVELFDGLMVGQVGSAKYMVHQFKVFLEDPTSSYTILLKGETTLLPSLSTIYLQIFNRLTNTWDTIDSNNGSSLAFRLAGDISDFSPYVSTNDIISCRVYQLAV